MTRSSSLRFCPSCRDERPAEQPPCADDHVECPEWICLDCGGGFVAGWLAVDLPERQTALARTA